MSTFNAPARRPNPVFSEEYEILRAILIEERRRAGLSQAQLAARIGKAKSHIALIERGQRRIDSLEFYVITKSLGANPAQVFARVTSTLDERASSSLAPAAWLQPKAVRPACNLTNDRRLDL